MRDSRFNNRLQHDWPAGWMAPPTTASISLQTRAKEQLTRFVGVGRVSDIETAGDGDPRGGTLGPDEASASAGSRKK